MDVTNLLLLMGVLLALLLLLVILYLMNRSGPSQKRRSAEKATQMKNRPPTFDALEAVILDRQSAKAELAGAVEAICSRYGVIRRETLSRYIRLVIALCRHPQTDKSVILALDSGLQARNPNFSRELDAALRKGLASRG